MKKEKLYNLFLHVAIVVLLVVVVTLAIQNRSLKSRGPSPSGAAIEIGDTLRLTSLLHVEGTPKLTEVSGRKIVFLLTTSCSYCKQNIPLWNELARLQEGSAGVLGICLSTDSAARALLREFPMKFSLFVPDDMNGFRTRNRIFGVPRTLYIDQNDVVGAMWVGELTESKLSEINNSLP